jgi:hypothetical protein
MQNVELAWSLDYAISLWDHARRSRPLERSAHMRLWRRGASQGRFERRRRHLAGVSWETWRSLGALGLPARACGVGVLRKTGAIIEAMLREADENGDFPMVVGAKQPFIYVLGKMKHFVGLLRPYRMQNVELAWSLDYAISLWEHARRSRPLARSARMRLRCGVLCKAGEVGGWRARALDGRRRYPSKPCLLMPLPSSIPR